MSSLRSHVVIDASPDAVWKVVSDAANIADWFPAMRSSTGGASTGGASTGGASTGGTAQRTVVLQNGATIVEDIVTVDPVLRRFQYRAVGGDLPVESHLGTVDVIELEPGRSLVVYSTEISPESLAGAFDGAISEAVAGLPQHVR